MKLEEYSKEALQEELERRDKKVSAHLVKDFIKKSNVKQWQIAEYLGMNEFSLSRKLRNEIAPEFEKQILIAIMQIKQERGH